MELCTSSALVVSNAFHGAPVENTVAAYNVGHSAMEEITWDSHSQIDFALCPAEWQHVVLFARVTGACPRLHITSPLPCFGDPR